MQAHRRLFHPNGNREEIMKEEINKSVYELVTQFLQLISEDKPDLLMAEFGISIPIYEEIKECLVEYFDAIQPMALAPFDIAFQRKGQKRPFCDIYEMNDANHLGIEFVIWVNAKETEAILHGEIDISNNKLTFQYKYIGS